MASLRRLFLLLPALTALGLTCVTSVQQRGPAGPWVGEVTNYDTQAANEVAVQARVVDANGQPSGLGCVRL